MSAQGIETGKRLGESFGARVHLAHVFPPLQGSDLLAVAIAWQETPASLAKALKEGSLSELKSLASKYALSTGDNLHFREGAPVFDVISSLASEIPADLLVVPTHAFRGVKRFFLGSTAERLVQHSPCPILVDRRSATRLPAKRLLWAPSLRIDKILVPVDFSTCSLDGLRYAIQFAQRFGANITVLHVLDLGYAQPMDINMPRELTRFARAATKDGAGQMRRFVKRLKFGRIRFKTELLIGTPVAEISDFARANDFDLIVTATHGLTGFKHVLMGSIAEHLVRRSQVPILVVPSHPEVRRANITAFRKSRSRAQFGRKRKGRGTSN
nr:universal stress protein family [uncultured bacterium]